MFLLLSVRHVRAHPGEHQHGISIQISMSLGKTFRLRISRIRNIPVTWILVRVLYVPPFISQILRLYLLNGFDFYFDLFWMTWHWKPAIETNCERKIIIFYLSYPLLFFSLFISVTYFIIYFCFHPRLFQVRTGVLVTTAPVHQGTWVHQ